MCGLQQLTGDLWQQHKAGHIIAITTGGMLKKKGSCVMPRGTALQAAKRFPGISFILGKKIKQYGMHVFDLGDGIVSFPVQNSPFENPELKIIRQSCRELVKLANDNDWSKIIVPRPGCGHGGLSWSEVQPVLTDYIDSRFIIIREENEHEAI